MCIEMQLIGRKGAGQLWVYYKTYIYANGANGKEVPADQQRKWKSARFNRLHAASAKDSLETKNGPEHLFRAVALAVFPAWVSRRCFASALPI